MKERAAGHSLKRIQPSVIYLSLRYGNTVLSPCVQEGQRLCVGDVVARDPAQVIPPVHSGISGTVTAVGISHPAADGGEAPTVVIQSDGKHTAGALMPPLSSKASPEEIVQRMYDGGLVGMGGGGFPTHRKYRDVQAEWLLINVCECEPYLAGDVRLSAEQPALIAEGARLFARAAGVSEDHIRLCAESDTAVRSLTSTGLAVEQLPKCYPQGSERQLIQAVLGKRLPDGTFPSQFGIQVSNAATAAAMGDAARGLPLTHRPLTVSGQVMTPVNLLVPVGTPFEEAAAQITPVKGVYRLRYIAGGPMTGRRLSSLKAGIPKTCGGLTVLASRSFPETPCIRCGACVRACPAALMPFLIDAAALAEDHDRCGELRVGACLSCGCCSFVCPARRKLAARITAQRRLQKEGSP
jgi:electron transport complex protein RnfC